MTTAHRIGTRGAALAVCAALLALAVLPAQAAPKQGAKAATKAASKAAPADAPGRVLVRVGGVAITRGDVERRLAEIPEQFRSQYTTPDGRQQLLDRMIDERVWLQRALQQGVGERPAVKQQLEQQRRDLLIRTYLTELMSANPAPSDSDAQAYYEAHLDDYRTPATVSLSHILTPSQDRAKQVRMWADRGQDWKKLVDRYSVDTLTRASGGKLGTVTKEGVFASLGTQPALAESALALGVGRIGGPYQTSKGWSVIKVDALNEGGTRPLEQVEPMIKRQLTSQRSQDYYRELLEQARRDLQVRPDSSAIRDFVSQRKSPREMFDEAQQVTAPTARIDAFEAMLRAYPDDPLAAQAQFMVGFIYSDELKDYDRAEKAFRELLKRFPKSELAASAQWMVEHMRSTDVPTFNGSDEDTLAPERATTKAEGRSPKP
ncbi:MAG: hypothetical protein A2W00_09905 [Candidatus Eisenbacteria bacterium RBG_16_71_46]|nr:MAG: hypothetical protein A2W00_09905 [Candidatus Eisenbacteria bacterium RBG_16_71_46]OGF20857.1 MAG: hypothetical protein A2V63_11530 [Candidatus Eisenbacteria bacterium RBG_19FT_COMBO_70_11]